MDYYSRFEELTSLMTTMEGFDIPKIYQILSELCVILRVSKGVTTYYASEKDEQAGRGEVFVCYDSKEEHELASHLRRVMPAGTVIVCDVYQAKGAEPLDEKELQRVRLIQQMMLSCINETRQQKMVDRLLFFDDDGYHNLRYFFSEIGRMLASGPYAFSGKSAARFNLKHYSIINEKIGHKAGSEVMRRFCQILNNTGGDNTILARLGGDNFVMLFDTDHLAGVQQCFAGLPVFYQKGADRVDVDATAGIWTITDSTEVTGPGTIMDHIITAFQIAKKDGTEDVIFYTDELKARRELYIEISRKFSAALEEGEFVAFYQPKVDIKTRKVIGAEALCRWNDNGNIVPPIEFIPILEQGTDICRLDFYMLDRVCKDIRRWMEEGRAVVKVSVNFSRRHMTDPDLFSHIIRIVDRNEVPHEYIEIELTETTTDVEFKELKRVVRGLQDVGISASVDDFGSGYSSLNLIKQIPWDILKLDRSILPADGEDIERTSHMFAHVIAMAHEIGMTCVAEGVETETQLGIMRDYGCRIAQGFLFDKPLQVRDFEKRLEAGGY